MLLMFLLACGDKSLAGDSASEETEHSEHGEVSSIAYYLGTSQAYTAEGDPDGGLAEFLYRRVFDVDAGTIVEDLTVHGDGGTQSVNRALVVDGDAFSGTFTDDMGSGEIAGEHLLGDAWAWMIWDSVSTYTDGAAAGQSVASHAEVHSRGLAGERTLYDASGAPLGSYLEEGSPVDQETFEAALR